MEITEDSNNTAPAFLASNSGAPTDEYSFQFMSSELEIVQKALEIREQLLQYNLNAETNNLMFYKFRFHGQFNGNLTSDYDTLLREFFSSPEVVAALQVTGEVNLPVIVKYSQLGLNVVSMDFFQEKLNESNVLSAEGRIRGCFDETYDGILVSFRQIIINLGHSDPRFFHRSATCFES